MVSGVNSGVPSKLREEHSKSRGSGVDSNLKLALCSYIGSFLAIVASEADQRQDGNLENFMASPRDISFYFLRDCIKCE